MKIRDDNRFNNVKRGAVSTPRENKSSSGLFSIFSSELETRKIEIESYDKDINDLRDEIDTAGQQLEKEPTLANFTKFRDMLSRLAKRVSGEAYRLEKIGGTAMNPRYYEIITVIDKEADKLYQLVINEQKDRMAITAAVIGIKGLVVDLIT